MSTHDYVTIGLFLAAHAVTIVSGVGFLAWNFSLRLARVEWELFDKRDKLKS